MGSDAFSGVPRVVLDRELSVLAADEAARACGILPGERLVPLQGECERRRHAACFSRAANTRYDPLGDPQNAALFRLRPVGGHTVLYVEYAYTLSECRACGALFADMRSYLSASLPRRKESLSLLIQAGFSFSAPARDAADALTEEAGYAARRARVPSRRGIAWELGTLVRCYLRGAAARNVMPDCAVRAAASEAPLFTGADPESLLLILALTLRACGDISSNRTVDVSCEAESGACLLSLSTEAPALASLLVFTSDLCAVAPRSPSQPGLFAAEYIAGMCGYGIAVTGEDSRIRISFRLPAASPDDLFRSPFETERLLAPVVEAVLRILSLPDDQQKHEHP
jgi:hypothetical protein